MVPLSIPLPQTNGEEDKALIVLHFLTGRLTQAPDRRGATPRLIWLISEGVFKVLISHETETTLS